MSTTMIRVAQYTTGGMPTVSMRCPACRQVGTFETLLHVLDVSAANYLLGQRRCPKPGCNTHVFVVCSPSGQIHRAYPAELIDFDPSQIPANLVHTFSQALECHANGLHIPAAIMIRRTLEEVCEDKQAPGKDLRDRIAALSNLVLLPKALMDAMHELRLLGNDAAHVEAKTYDAIGEDEIRAAIT